MRTNVEVDVDALQQVQTLGNFGTKKAAIQAALINYLNVLKRQQLLALRGKVAWQGDQERYLSLPESHAPRKKWLRIQTARDRAYGATPKAPLPLNYSPC